MDVLIRPAHGDDAPALLALLQTVGELTALAQQEPTVALANVQRQLDQALASDSHTILLATQSDGVVVGYLAVHWLPYLFLAGPEGFVSELFIHAQARGQSVGTQLLAALVAEARGRGCSRLQLINFRNRESYQRAFYRKAGWVERPDAADFVYVLST